MKQATWKQLHTGIKQVRANLRQGDVPAAIRQLDDLDTEVTTRRSQSQIDSEITQLAASLATFSSPEQAYKHCCLLYTRDWFLQEPDTDYKIALTSFLHRKWPHRNELWLGIYNRNVELLYLL